MARRRGNRTDTRAELEFVSEAEDIIEQMRCDLADLDDQCASDVEVDPDLVNRVFRAAHSFKGLAGLFGFEPVHDLAHHLEDVLDGLRLGRIEMAGPALGLIDEVVRLFTGVLASVGDDAAMEAVAGPVTELSGRIEALIHKGRTEPDFLETLDVDPALLRALTEYEEHRLRESLRRGRYICLVDATFEIIAFEEGLTALSDAIRSHGEVISTLPSPGDAPDAQIRFSLLVASSLAPDALARGIDFDGASLRSVASPDAPVSTERSRRTVADSESEDPAVTGLAESEGSASGAELFESLKSISDTVRVDIAKLDELMALVGELVIQRRSLGDVASRLRQDPATLRLAGDLAKIHEALDRKLRGLQSAVLDVRMVPLSQVFEKVSRVVRKLRRELDKDAVLEVEGANTELDKLIVEELVDPLMHIVRNALDHAMEPPDERAAAGKDPQGRIRIAASQRGNHVVIDVTDDGRGIDLERLRAKAEANGLIESGAHLSEQETLDLVFEPGLTTRDDVSTTSGRGVGMDVVRANLQALGGVVDVRSTAGRGTSVQLTLPITLAIIQSLIVRVDPYRFAIPLTSVLETQLIEASEIQRSEGRELLYLRGAPLALRSLRDVFELPGDDADKRYAVIVGHGAHRLGLLVDELEGQQDTVIKPIEGPIRSIPGIAGAADLGDRDPILILDVASILDDSGPGEEGA